MSTKLFKNDKNYILKSVQNDTKKELLKYLIEISIHKYEVKSNPLGLVDDSIKKLNKIKIIDSIDSSTDEEDYPTSKRKNSSSSYI